MSSVYTAISGRAGRYADYSKSEEGEKQGYRIFRVDELVWYFEEVERGEGYLEGWAVHGVGDFGDVGGCWV